MHFIDGTELKIWGKDLNQPVSANPLGKYVIYYFSQAGAIR